MASPKILNIEGLSDNDIISLVGQGGKFVQFEYVISLLVIAYKQYSDIYFIRPGQSASGIASHFTNISLLWGWWSIPGIFWTLEAISLNRKGGKDHTKELMKNLSELMEKEKEFQKSQQEIIDSREIEKDSIGTEDKLKSLKEMFEQGLIDEEEYKLLKGKTLSNL